MTNVTLPDVRHRWPSTISVKTALKLAWLFWGLLLAVPFFFLQWLIWQVTTGDTSRFHSNDEKWFIISMGYLLVVLPGLFFLRGHLFRDYWLGRPVPPSKYVLATILIGVALATGGIISLIGCLVTDAFMPNLIPGLLSLLLFVLHWPTGRAMIKTVGNEHDQQEYEEPR